MPGRWPQTGDRTARRCAVPSDQLAGQIRIGARTGVPNYLLGRRSAPGSGGENPGLDIQIRLAAQCSTCRRREADMAIGVSARTAAGWSCRNCRLFNCILPLPIAILRSVPRYNGWPIWQGHRLVGYIP